MNGATLLLGDAADGGDPPTGGVCLTAWDIEDGRVADVDVSRLVVVAVAQRNAGGSRRLLFVDDRADPEQLRWLLDAFQGRLGGPLAELAATVTHDLGFYQAPVQCILEDGVQTVAIPPRVAVVLASGDGLPSRVVSLDASAVWLPSRASRGWVSCPEHGIDCDLGGCLGLRGRFHMESEDTAAPVRSDTGPNTEGGTP